MSDLIKLYDENGERVGTYCIETGRAQIGNSFFVTERTCTVTRESVDIDGTCMTNYSCGCCSNEGWNHNYCPNCGAKVLKD